MYGGKRISFGDTVRLASCLALPLLWLVLLGTQICLQSCNISYSVAIGITTPMTPALDIPALCLSSWPAVFSAQMSDFRASGRESDACVGQPVSWLLSTAILPPNSQPIVTHLFAMHSYSICFVDHYVLRFQASLHPSWLGSLSKGRPHNESCNILEG